MSFDEVRALWQHAVTLCGPRVGLEAAGFVTHGTFDLFEHLAKSRATLGEAVREGGAFMRLINELWQRDLEVRGKIARVVQCPPAGVTLLPQMSEYALGLAVAVARSMVGEHLCPSEVSFMHEVDDAAPHEAYFRAPVLFGEPCNAVTFPSAVLSRRLSSADASLKRVLERYMRRLEQERPATHRLSDDVCRLILERLPEDVTMPTIAGLMSMSQRTLRRKLAAEGTKHSALLDNCRRQLALEYLGDGVSVAEVSERLGYFDPSAFRKAHKRWTKP